MRKLIGNETGSTTSFILYIMLIIFVLLPLSAVLMEKYIINNKAESIKDSIDITNLAVYTAIVADQAGEANIVIDEDRLASVFRNLLSKNLRLNSDLTPKENSIADGIVVIKTLNVHTSGFPVTCPNGTTITKPTVCTEVAVPIKPSVYSKTVLDMLGVPYLNLNLHVDSEIPINN